MMKISSFYKFFSIKKQDLPALRSALEGKAQALKLRGMAGLATEGLNATFCGKAENIDQLKPLVCSLFKQEFFWKDSSCEKWGFKRLSIKIKRDIINAGKVAKAPFLPKELRGHISPKEWEKKLKTGGVSILDVRNHYETQLGRFKGALDLNMANFQEFPDKLKNAPLQKDKETLIYCTGGIRCEKAVGIMKNRGFKQVWQLEGGILNYLREYPHSQFTSECFVFDHRAALDQDLKASVRYSLCPHCGQAGDKRISCLQCGREAVVCKACESWEKHRQTCSKNCAYHFKSGHRARKRFSK